MRSLNEDELSKYNKSLDNLFKSIYVIVFYNRTAQQMQSIQLEAESKFRAGRLFYRKYKGKCRIELIHKVTV